MHSPTSDVSAAPRGPGPGYAYLRPPATTTTNTDTHCYCQLCAHDKPSNAVPAASVPEFRSGTHSRASPEEEEGVTAQEGPRARRPFPSQSRRRGGTEEELERNGINGGHVPPKNPSRRVDFYLGPDHCSLLGDTTPSFPREWDPCYSPPPRWNWPAVEPCREHCACTREVWPEWERIPLPPPPLPPSPCCYSPKRRSSSTSLAPYQSSPEFRGYLRHREVLHGSLAEPCWECMRDRYWRDGHRPDLIAVDSKCGCSANGQRQQALSPVLSYSHEPMSRQHQHQHQPQHQHQRISRQTSPEQGTFNGLMTPGPRTFFSTEVPPAKLQGAYEEEPSSCRPKSVNGPQRREPKLEAHKDMEKEKEKEKEVNQHQSQGSVREQIRRVVGDLEEVLGGLKQVHLEMKEVVQQIDVLTCGIALAEDELGRQTSHESVLQQQIVRHEVKALVHRAANAHTSQELKQQQQPQGMNGHPSPTPSPKPSTVHPSVTQRGHTISGDLPQVTAPIPGHEVAKDRSKMNGTCVAPRPPRDRVKDAQRRRIEMTSPSISLTPNGGAASIKNHKPPPYPNHNGRVETLHKDSDVPTGALRTAAQTGKGRQVSTAV